MRLVMLIASLFLSSAAQAEVDWVIRSDRVFTGEQNTPQALDVALCGERICRIAPLGAIKTTKNKLVDARGLIVAPGFIDPHTHALPELMHADKAVNANYLTQGVTTVVVGNDGAGSADIQGRTQAMLFHGIGTNVGLLVGHGAVRKQVLGQADTRPDKQQLAAMKTLVREAMKDGALGLSSGLFYTPGSFADTQEVIALAQEVAPFSGYYDTHLRDEGAFNVGILAALDEAIAIAENASVPLHISHLKLLGVDVWGQSQAVIKKVEQAHERGVVVSADQYPWLASGTSFRAALVPRWARAGGEAQLQARLTDTATLQKIKRDMADNLRGRGGADSLLITRGPTSYLGQTLGEVAEKREQSAVDTAIELIQEATFGVASFNMQADDVKALMKQPWVVTSSDGSDGHPRKFASFPRKYQDYVRNASVLTLAQFIHQSSSKTADVLGLPERGRIKVGYYADLTVFHPKNYAPRATFEYWDRFSTGVRYLFVNGVPAIDEGELTGRRPGRVLRRQPDQQEP
ncbi:N-acyl-D-amino-acid deacylase [Saliniradius amylolyticus]|uniref:N-acyl-D-amino-acid deacylase n=1 Tax=Saliniradius amylolyticus TaxID=2183582 RepID=A0A2S2DZC5_9ALTE|nr:amidohydrolase family protein [Saliniradius amylolyticus]AWL10758.1 N-acyl-D-amino-acid deacylase [Saliniradius amylolyticus]